MIFYYIDDSFFQNHAFSRVMFERLMRYLMMQAPGTILISAANGDNEHLQQFIKDETGVMVLQSPVMFDVQGVRGNLHTMYLEIEGFDRFYAYSGSCIKIDVKKQQVERIYFDLFPDYKYDELLAFVKLQKEAFEHFKDFKKKFYN